MAIVKRTHAVDGAVYWTRRTCKNGYIIFIPTDRDDSDCHVSPDVSATMLRKAFLSLHSATRQFRDEKRLQVLNIDLLAIYLRLDYRWMERWTWKRLSGQRNAEDDLGVERMKREKRERKRRDDEGLEKKVKRRASFESA